MAPDKKQEESDSDMRQRLVNSLSQSFPGSALSKALKLMDPLDEVDGDLDPLNSSCYAEIRLDKEPIDDDELTSLSWLQDSDLLKNINAGEDDEGYDGQKENNGIKLEPKDGAPQMHPPHVPYNPQKHINSKPPYSFSCLIFMAIEDSPQKRLPVKDIYSWILTHFPYFQNAPTGWKNSVRHNLSLNKCFKKVEKEKGQSIGKGSLWCIDPEYRPNLLQALRKTPYHPYHQLQMLASPQPSYQYAIPGAPRPLPLTTRININTPSPHLFPFLSKRLAQSKLDSESDIDVANTLVSLKGSGTFRPSENPRLKPLTPLNSFQNGRHYQDRSPSPPEFGSEKYHRRRFSPYPPKKRSGSPIIFTTNPSQDHTYSVTPSVKNGPNGDLDSPTSSIDEEYEFGHHGHNAFSDVDESSDGSYRSNRSDYDESEAEMEDHSETLQEKFKRMQLPVKKRYSRFIHKEDDETAKIVEGADALLNLAGIKTSRIVPIRSISPMNNNNSIVVKKEVENS